LSGECNVVAGEMVETSIETFKFKGFSNETEIYIGTNIFTSEPLSIVSRSDDAQFSDFLRWIMHVLFYAGEQNIGKNDYTNIPSDVHLFGHSLSKAWQNVIKTVGSYSNIFTRNLDGILEQINKNRFNVNSELQMHSVVDFKWNAP